MAKPDKRPPQSLPFELANILCQEFIPIGRHIFDYMAGLESAGFAAFKPLVEFTCSFCTSPEELEVHRQCLIGWAEERIGQPFPYRMTAEQKKQLYRSPILQKLRAKRDAENGVPYDQLPTCYPGELWRREADPCSKRLKRMLVENKEEYERRNHQARTEALMLFEVETQSHSVGTEKVYRFDKRGRYEFLKEIMERETAALDFFYDKSKSFPDFPVFTWRINDLWDLCWTIEEQRAFYWIPASGNLDFELQVRRHDLRGSSEKSLDDNFLILRHREIMPGFAGPYRRFNNLDELETIIKAHLCLYSLIAPILQAGLRKVLGGPSS